MFCAGLCARCYWSAQHSRRRFDGHRERVLARDRHRCRACGAGENLAVHHRRRGVHQPRLLITLCAACHARVHRLAALRSWLEPALVSLWREQHRGVPLQLQFPWDQTA
jgi:5-methylcytosine-specific restriction endonuclease McrA